MVILLMVSFGVAKKYTKVWMKVCGFGNWYILRCQKTQDMIKSEREYETLFTPDRSYP